MDILEATIVDANSSISEQQTEELYRQVFPRVALFVSKMGGSLDDAKDIFHDALIINLENSTQKRLEIHISEEAYILGISKHLWNRKYTRDLTIVSLNDIEKTISIPDDYFPSFEEKRLLRFLEYAGKRCMNLLRTFYYEQVPMKRLAHKLGYTNEHSASVQKYKCLEKVREAVKEKSLTYDDFVE
ncbi:MAG: sigma-70 family RNA polymerase sigma factor [Bacteroidetes bacterium]|nr:sigma-70 family RNA polymerase sigma factor [Bacteroidota bacterium]